MHPILGSAPYRYECHHDWGELPTHIVWGKTHAAAIDARQRVYICHTAATNSSCKDTIVIFDRAGNFLSSWGAAHVGHAHGLLLHRNASGVEELYLVDDQKGIFLYTLEGELLRHIGKPDFYDRENLKYGPANMAIAPNGDLYLAEGYGAAYVLRFDPQGKLIQRFGGRGDTLQHTTWAHGVFIAEVAGEPATAGKPLLHICVDAPSAIKRFTLDGRYHSHLPGEFLHPRNIYAQGDLWAIPEMQGRLTLLDSKSGATFHLGHWGKPMEEIFELRKGTRDTFPVGAFVSAHGVAFFPNGDMIVTEWVEVGRVNKLTRVN